MSDPVDALILDLIEWIGRGGKPYREVMDAWRTSCPRLPVWEEANSRGFVTSTHRPGGPTEVAVTPAGWAYAEGRRAMRASPAVRVAGSRSYLQR